jgi:hypothetical protein
MNRPVLAVGLAFMMVLSGCSFLGGGTPTPSPTASPTQTPVPETTPPAIEGDNVNETALLFNHLRASQSRTYTLVYNISGPNVENETFRQETDAGQVPMYTELELPASGSATYYVNSTGFVTNRDIGVISFTRSEVENGTFITAFLTNGVSVTPGDRRLATFIIPFEYSPAGTRTVDGEELTVVEATSTNAFQSRPGVTILPENRQNATSVEATVAFDDSGVIRRVQHRYEFPDGTFRLDIRVTDVGSTTVEEPEWLGAACRSTNFSENLTVECPGQ